MKAAVDKCLYENLRVWGNHVVRPAALYGTWRIFWHYFNKRAGQSRQMTKFLPKHFPDMIIKTEDYCDRDKIISKGQLFCALVGAVSFRQSQQINARFIAMIIWEPEEQLILHQSHEGWNNAENIWRRMSKLTWKPYITHMYHRLK